MTSRGANDVTGRRHEGRSTSPWSKLVIAGTVGGACTIVTACFVLCILVCRRWIRDKRAARRRRLKRRQRTVSTNSSTVRGSSATPSVCSARHTLPALPGDDLSIPLPPDVDVNGGAMTCWNQPKHASIDWSVDNDRRYGREARRMSPFVVVDVPGNLRRSSASNVTGMTLTDPSTQGEDALHGVWWSRAPAAACMNHNTTTTTRCYMSASPHQTSAINTSSPPIHRHRGESDRWKADISSANRDGGMSTDVNFNLSQYIIQRENDSRQRQRIGQWHTSRSADSSATNRNWRRADLADETPARERNTWELTHRFPEFPAVRAFPAARLVTGSGASNGDELAAAAESSDEDVWIPRLSSQPSRRRAKNAPGCVARDCSELESSPACGDVLQTRTTPTTRLCSTRS